MIQIACECNWNIPGVEKLPSHDHNQERNAKDLQELNPGDEALPKILEDHFPLRDGVHIWVPWKEVARALTCGRIGGDEYRR